ncbi:tectonin domain-containing protein [Poseidonocella sp. HB161398]|uniref:tectonin domain-containing protein n=1 Tax=Poseidonocella sp. HB161398 TaxID=2320855 RepID=UPI00110938A2|nr:tectonin domain-containing protein [Poseidonocella sp. HB161398]
MRDLGETPGAGKRGTDMLSSLYLPPGPDGQCHLYEPETMAWARIEFDGDYFRGTDIAIGADGSVWVVGNDPRPGGFGIYRWNGRVMEDRGGAGTGIAVGPDGLPWTVDDAGNIARLTPEGWRAVPGQARDIGIGADGSVWIIGCDRREGGYGIYRREGGDWVDAGGAALRISVSPEGEPWVVTEQNFIFRRLGERWFQVQGGAVDIAVGADGNVWIAGSDHGWHGGYTVYHWNGRNFESIGSAGGRVAVAPNGMLWLINFRNGVYRRVVRV